MFKLFSLKIIKYLGHIQVHGLVFLIKHVLVCSLLLFRNSYTSFYTGLIHLFGVGVLFRNSLLSEALSLGEPKIIYLTLSYSKFGHVD